MTEISLTILDLARNSFKANATCVNLEIVEDDNNLTITIIDNGDGMDKNTLESVVDPFYTTRTTRKVGLGIPFAKMAAELTGGSLEFSSSLGVGTELTINYKMDSVDMIPLGNMVDTVCTLLCNEYNCDIVYTHNVSNIKEIKIDSRELKEILDGVSLLEPSIMAWVKENLETQYGG